jgi:hypothetical protein
MRKVIRRQIAHRGEGLDLAADVNAVIAINHGAGADEERREEAPHTVRRTTVASSRVESDDRDESPKEDR